MGRPYYLFKNGRLRRHQNTLFIEGDEKRAIPVEDVSELYLFGELDLNTKLVNFLGQKGIPVHIFNYYGYYTGTFYPREGNVSGLLVVRQVEHYLDPGKRLAIAGKVVEAALFNLRRNLLYYQHRGRDLGGYIVQIEDEAARIERAGSVEELMGIEGRVRDAYYAAFNRILDLETPFVKRVRRPPNNMINALISFGNSLCYTAVLAELYVTQLNPTVSYLHEPGMRRFSLALDLAEIFKPLLVDRAIFKLLNKEIIGEEDFESIKEAEGVYLSEEGRKKFLREWDERLQTTIKHRRLKRNVSYRQLMRLEGYKLVRHLLGMETYEGLKAWW